MFLVSRDYLKFQGKGEILWISQKAVPLELNSLNSMKKREGLLTSFSFFLYMFYYQ